MTNKHADLIAKLESATEGSRELDADVACTLCGHTFQAIDQNRRVIFNVLGVGTPVWRALNDIPYYTTSLDDARALSDWILFDASEIRIPAIILGNLKSNAPNVLGNANTLALAWCVAALKAKEINDGGKDNL